MSLTQLIPVAVIALLASAAQAQTPPATGADHAAHHPASASAPAPASAAAALADAEVRKIDKAQGKITLRHGPIAHLDMPPMTMVFRTADPALLDGLKEGDKVKFATERINGAFTVTAIVPVR